MEKRYTKAECVLALYFACYTLCSDKVDKSRFLNMKHLPEKFVKAARKAIRDAGKDPTVVRTDDIVAAEVAVEVINRS